jgi:hypothetical protein
MFYASKIIYLNFVKNHIGLLLDYIGYKSNDLPQYTACLLKIILSMYPASSTESLEWKRVP